MPANSIMAPSSAKGGLHENDAAFLQRFAAREAENRATKQKATLSVEQHAAHRAQISNVRFIKPQYANETQINISSIFNKWRRYCVDLKITSWGTSHEYIRQFQQLYITVNGQYMDRNDTKEVYKYYRSILIPRFGHRPPNIDSKPMLNVDNLLVILTFNIAYDKRIFPGERHRIGLAACDQILCYTGARPAELVDAERKKPKDGAVEELFGCKVVQSTSSDDGGDPESPPDEDSKLLQGLLCQETVGRGRPKALCYEDIQMMIVRHPVTGRCMPAIAIKFIHHKRADRKPKPTIFYFTPARRLLFYAVSSMLALALHDNAFDAPSLVDASAMFRAKPPRFKQCIPLRWKASKWKIPVFRRFRGTTLSEDEPMLYSKLRDDIGQQSLDSGHEKKWTPRFARRGAGNAANDPRFITFHHAYLNEIANFDLQNAFLEEEKENQLFRLFAHVSLTRDPRATSDIVPDEVWANLAPDLEIYWIEGHEEEYAEPVIDVTIPECARLARILCHQPDDLTEDDILETVKRDRMQQRAKACLPIKTEPLEAETDPLPSPDRFPLLMYAAQCPDCIGDERLSCEERAFTYCRPTVINDHFDDYYLVARERAEQCNEMIRCKHPKCKDHKLIHGVTLRSSEQVKQR
ncbi:hypothetical protein B0J13DRAFT_595275 [Dactylonectria estremocensis]|uniref:FluG domain-containing protein n=1 Tax=Dactylonectria estremocensis TaxID=1079267 RepID=A0A9P9EXT6_9HYPO|nr:hypothetical protein B0J13DRAFT_595275 [Dactylonectria estremocensis]